MNFFSNIFKTYKGEDLKKLITQKEQFKKTARIITVNLDEVEILSNSWNEVVSIESEKAMMYNQVLGFENQNFKEINRELNTIIIKININGKLKTIQFNIEMNSDRLKIKLALKKTTNYYYDLNKPGLDFLDLAFLKDNVTN